MGRETLTLRDKNGCMALSSPKDKDVGKGKGQMEMRFYLLPSHFLCKPIICRRG
jgi:hypothetical protein